MANLLLKENVCRNSTEEERNNFPSDDHHFVSYWKDLSNDNNQLIHWFVDKETKLINYLILENLLPEGISLKTILKKKPLFQQFQMLKFEHFETVTPGSQNERFYVPNHVLPHKDAYESQTEGEEEEEEEDY